MVMLGTYLGLDDKLTTFHVNRFDPEAVPLLQSGVKLISATYGAFSAATRNEMNRRMCRGKS